MKNLCINNKRTTGAEDTQNQHYQWVLTVFDTPSQTERVSFVEEVFMMSEGGPRSFGITDLSRLRPDTAPTSIHQSTRRTDSDRHGSRQCNSPRSVHCMRRGRQKAQFFTRFDNQRMDNFVSSIGACRRHVPTVSGGLHDSMIADALTKRHGNSVTMFKFVKTGQLSIVIEDKELAEVISGSPWSQSTSTRQHESKSSGPVDWEKRYAVGCANTIPRASELEANLSTSRFQSQF